MRSRLILLPVALGVTLLAIVLQAPRSGQNEAAVEAAGGARAEIAEKVQPMAAPNDFPGWVGAGDGSRPLAENAPASGSADSSLAGAVSTASAPSGNPSSVHTPSAFAEHAGPALTSPFGPVQAPAGAAATPATASDVPATTPATTPNGAPAGTAPAVAAPEGPAADLPASQQANLRARVLEPDGTPVADAGVVLRPTGSAPAAKTAAAETAAGGSQATPPAAAQSLVLRERTDSEGRAHFSALAPGRYDLHLESSGLRLGPGVFELHDRGAVAEVILGPGETRESTLTAPPRARPFGAVWSAGSPLIGAKLILTDTLHGARAGADAPGSVRREALSVQGGAFAFPPVPPGRYDVAVEHADLREALRFALDLGEGRSEHRFAFEPAEVAGRVRDDAGQPVPGARLWIAGGGRPECVGLDGEKLLVAASADRAPERRGPEESLSAVTDANGFYILSGVSPAPGLELCVEAPGFAPHRVRVELLAASSRRLDLALTRGAELELVLVDDKDRGLAGAWVGLSDPDGRTRVGLTDAAGRVRWSSVTPGAARVVALPFGPQIAGRELDLVAGERAELILALP